MDARRPKRKVTRVTVQISALEQEVVCQKPVRKQCEWRLQGYCNSRRRNERALYKRDMKRVLQKSKLYAEFQKQMTSFSHCHLPL